MKRPLLIMAAMVAAVASFGQAKIDSSKFLKPGAGNFSTELNVNPFNGQVSLNNALNQIKVRYFVTPDFALRLGFNISKIDSTNNINNAYGTNSYFSNNKRTASTAGINIGIEKHFLGTKRLSPYIGADLSYTDKSAHQTITDSQTTTNVNNAWYYTYYSGTTVITSVQQNGYTRYGVNLFAGFDFYIAQHFFFGYEFNYGLNKTNWKNVNITTANQTTPTTSNNNIGKNSTLNFGPTLINGIRLGYSF